MGNRLCVPANKDLKEELIEEAHLSPFSIHTGETKMYQDMRIHFWWVGMKCDVDEFVSKCLTCQQVKIEHQRPSDLLHPLEIPTWKWENICMDLVIGLPKTLRKNYAIWVIMDRLTKSAHFLAIRGSMSWENLALTYRN